MFSGKAKDVQIYENNKIKLIFRDSISAFDGEKKDNLQGKGEVNCRMSAKLFEILNGYGIHTHYHSMLDNNTLICDKVEIIPVEIVCRNVTAGSFCKRYGIEKGLELSPPVIEFFYKDDELHDPLVTQDVAIQLGWMIKEEAMLMEAITRAVNTILAELFDMVSLQLVDFKLEFGRTHDGRIIIADEISGDSMRLWDKETGEIKDKDRYRKGMGDVIQHYNDVYDKLSKLSKLPDLSLSTKARVIVKLKKTVLDPAGEVTLRSLNRMNYQEINNARLGKHVFVNCLTAPSSELLKNIRDMSEKLFSNPLIEDYFIDLWFEEEG